MLKKTCKLQSTQKAESMNSAFRVTSPKKHCNIFTKLCWQRQQCHPTHQQWAWGSTSPQCLSSKGSLGWWGSVSGVNSERCSPGETTGANAPSRNLATSQELSTKNTSTVSMKKSINGQRTVVM